MAQTPLSRILMLALALFGILALFLLVQHEIMVGNTHLQNIHLGNTLSRSYSTNTLLTLLLFLPFLALSYPILSCTSSSIQLTPFSLSPISCSVLSYPTLSCTSSSIQLTPTTPSFLLPPTADIAELFIQSDIVDPAHKSVQGTDALHTACRLGDMHAMVRVFDCACVYFFSSTA
jgi:hypothetical protein